MMMTSFWFPHLCGFLYSLIIKIVSRNSKEMYCDRGVTLRNKVWFPLLSHTESDAQIVKERIEDGANEKAALDSSTTAFSFASISIFPGWTKRVRVAGIYGNSIPMLFTNQYSMYWMKKVIARTKSHFHRSTKKPPEEAWKKYSIIAFQHSICGSGFIKYWSEGKRMMAPPHDEHLQTSLP